MTEQRQVWRGIGLVALAAVVPGVCPAAEPSGTAWSGRARQIAEQRLAEWHKEVKCSHAVGTPANDAGVAPGMGVAADASEGFVEISAGRLVVDEPETPASGEAETQPTCAIERGPTPNLADTVVRDLKEAPGLLWHDLKKVYLNPWNVVFLVGAGGASLALRPEVDDDIEDHYNPERGRYRHTFSKPFRNFLDAAGNPGTGFIVAGTWYLGGQLLQDCKTYEVGKRMASALIITDLSTLLLKLCAADTKSPNGMFYAWPSGHMSSTVALATVLNDAYGPLVGVPAYAFCVFEGIERLDDREHKFSDVIFGAALGWVIAETVMKEHRPEIFGGEVVPYISVDGQNAGVAWLKSLGK